VRTFIASLVGVAMASLALGACNANLGANAAFVDGNPISEQRLDATLSAIASNSDYTCVLSSATGGLVTSGAGAGTYAQRFASSILTTLVEQEALAKAVAADHLAVTPFARSVAVQALQAQLSPPQGSSCSAPGAKVLSSLPSSYRRFLVDLQAEQAVLLAHRAGVALTKAGMAAYARAHPDASSLECISAIEVASRAEAVSLADKVRSGASFAQLAKRYSLDQASAPSGGALGCVLASQISPSLSSTVSSLAVGEVSAPVPFGSAWVIFQLSARKPASPDQVASVVLNSQLAKDQAVVSGALEAVQVHVDPRYGSWKRVAGIWQVVPPKGPPSALLPGSAASAVAPSAPIGASPLG
jgi:hypothetical protein